MNPQRVIDYANLLIQASINTGTVLHANLEAKKRVLGMIEKNIHDGAPLQMLAENRIALHHYATADLQVVRRLAAWLAHRETNIAYQVLKACIDEEFSLVHELDLKGDIKAVLSMSEQDVELIKKLDIVLQRQLQFLQQNPRPEDVGYFHAQFKTTLENEASIFHALRDLTDKETHDLKHTIRKLVKGTTLTGVAATAFAAPTAAMVSVLAAVRDYDTQSAILPAQIMVFSMAACILLLFGAKATHHDKEALRVAKKFAGAGLLGGALLSTSLD